MISLRIKNTKTFMSHLLVKDTFDNFLLSEADIKTSCSHSIDGQINRAFYSDEEWETLEGDARRYELWLNQKPFCFSLIKGSKVPSSMKIVMLMSTKDTEALLSQAIVLLLDNKIITPGQLVEDIGCSAEELEQYCFLDKGTLATKNDSKIIALKARG